MLDCPYSRPIAKTGSTFGSILVDNAMLISKRTTALLVLRS